MAEEEPATRSSNERAVVCVRLDEQPVIASGRRQPELSSQSHQVMAAQERQPPSTRRRGGIQQVHKCMTWAGAAALATLLAGTTAQAQQANYSLPKEPTAQVGNTSYYAVPIAY